VLRGCRVVAGAVALAALVLQRVQAGLMLFPAALARLGLLDREKGRQVFEIAMPAMVTGGIWTVFRIVDFFMVSVALDDAAVAGLAFGFQYYFIGFTLALGLGGGTISLVSRFKGAGEDARADFVVKQSLWLATLVALALTVSFVLAARPLIDLLTDDPAAIDYGATYLGVVMLGTVFRFASIVFSQALNGCGDTRTPMLVSLFTIPTNIALNAVLIFGLGPFPELGIAGAAWGTVVTSVLASTIFLAIYLSGRFAVRLRPGGRQWDTGIAVELVRIGTPLVGRRMANTAGNFPFLFVLGLLGTPVVAAFAIGSRIMRFGMIPGYGYSTAASALVGQALGAGDEREATDYGWQSARIALATQVLVAAVLVAFARPFVQLFGTEAVDLGVGFVRVLALGVVGASLAQTLQGGLRGAGDTTWPMYGSALGVGLRLVVSTLALPASLVLVSLGPLSPSPGLGLGVTAVFVGLLVDRYTRAVINAVRFRSGRWKRIAKESAARTATGDD